VNVYYDQAVVDVVDGDEDSGRDHGAGREGLRRLRKGTLASGFAPDEDANRASALAVDEGG
jgi:hypothetical protein